jgi:hypothetical protein
LLGKLVRTFAPKQKERTAQHGNTPDCDRQGTGGEASEQQHTDDECDGASLDSKLGAPFDCAERGLLSLELGRVQGLRRLPNVSLRQRMILLQRSEAS